jgi:hypothetical protein
MHPCNRCDGEDGNITQPFSAVFTDRSVTGRRILYILEEQNDSSRDSFQASGG